MTVKDATVAAIVTVTLKMNLNFSRWQRFARPVSGLLSILDEDYN
jgi:hypothetical protein